MAPAVGKSGPCTNSMSSSSVVLKEYSGVSWLLSLPFTMVIFPIMWTRASTISFKLCGGIFVAIPTAIPSDPMRSKFGSFAGK
ncbi:MAG: hypothetical protein ACD_48C00127G0002 [uncultured bacterium]|nr:MAG: hypothetical protein ACD_48C00127G0002 [uncultured bacterium]